MGCSNSSGMYCYNLGSQDVVVLSAVCSSRMQCSSHMCPNGSEMAILMILPMSILTIRHRRLAWTIGRRRTPARWRPGLSLKEWGEPLGHAMLLHGHAMVFLGHAILAILLHSQVFQEKGLEHEWNSHGLLRSRSLKGRPPTIG